MSTPDTINYMIAGYIFIFIILAGYIASLWVRFRKRRREIASLEESLD